MKYGTQSSQYGQIPLAEAIRLGREDGCDGFEFGLQVDGLRTGATTREELIQEAKEIATTLEKEKFGIISLTPDLLLKHDRYPEMVELACELANRVGTRTLRIFSYPYVRWGGPNSVLNDWVADFDGTTDYWTLFNTNVKQLADVFVPLAEKHDVRWVFELHHGYIINSASAAYNLLHRFDPRHVGVLVDPGNMVYDGGEGWRIGIEILNQYIDYFHCKNTQYNRGEDGKWRGSWDSLDTGIADYAEIVTALKDIGFGGYMSMEDLRGGLSTEEKVRKPIAYLRQLETSSVRVLPV